MNDIRGYNSFNSFKENIYGSNFALKASTKFIIYDFPFLKTNPNLLPFFYGNVFYENTSKSNFSSKNLGKAILS